MRKWNGVLPQAHHRLLGALQVLVVGRYEILSLWNSL